MEQISHELSSIKNKRDDWACILISSHSSREMQLTGHSPSFTFCSFNLKSKEEYKEEKHAYPATA